ncbi:MAG: sulfatase-like hydrolase/transferase [Acidobacteria bacterium]|nr:sulfatase-like hydrolase/transferase [Acidobacteriota bacterium]MBI3278787.1 sulfatase-like hydrolase/transferase [Acidobacteriota bacterium]
MTKTSRREFLATAAPALQLPSRRVRPNIVFLSCEDTSPLLGCYGDSAAITPVLDRFARQATRYTNAYTVAGVCAPSRSGIITGMYPSTLGSHHMRCQARLPQHVHCFPEYLRDAGYYCTNNSKTDYNFPVPRGAWDESSRSAHWRKRKPGQPFFAVFNFTITHESRIRWSGDEWVKATSELRPGQRQDPARMRIPPYHASAPATRRHWANFYELVTALDYQVGAALRELDEAGLADDTIVFFWGDHGTGLARAKRWLYDSGTRVPLLVRIPQKFQTAGQGRPGSVDDQLVSLLDLGPTVLHLAGVPVPEHMQGRAFLGPRLTPARDYVFGARDRMDERYDIIRAVRDRRYRYVRNYEPFKPYYQHMRTAEGSATMQDLRRLHAEGKLPPEAAQFMADHKPPEELYDLGTDPHEVRNLAASPELGEVLARMRRVHENWMRETGDLGLIPEPELVVRERELGSRYAIARQPRAGDLLARVRRMALTADPKELAAGLNDPDAAIRYWAATHLGRVDPAALNKARGDPAPVVRVAAARGLRDAAALATLLGHEEEWVRLHAALALDDLGTLAAQAKPTLRNALKDSNNYVPRVAEHALAALGA